MEIIAGIFKLVFLRIPVFIFTGLILLGLSQAQTHKIKDARSYFNAEHDSLYKVISRKRLESGQAALTESELFSIQKYEFKLDSAFKALPEKEQNLYFKNHNIWLNDLKQKELAAQGYTLKPDHPVDYVEIMPSYNLNRLRYIYVSGVAGLTYGSLSLALLERNMGPGAGWIIPGAAYVAVMIPAVWGRRYGRMSYTAFRMGAHGLHMAPWYSMALSGLIFGDELLYPGQADISGIRYASWGILTAGTVGLSQLAFNLGKNKGWNEARPLIYRTYARIGYVTGLMLPAMLQMNRYNSTDYVRVMSGSFLAGAAAGYMAGNMVNKIFSMTRGEAIVAEGMTLQGGVLALSIALSAFEGEDASLIMVPGSMALMGLMSAQITKNSMLTTDQGRGVALGSGIAWTGAALGSVILIRRPGITPLVAGSLAGLVTTWTMTRLFRDKNQTRTALSTLQKESIQFALLPSPSWFQQKSIKGLPHFSLSIQI